MSTENRREPRVPIGPLVQIRYQDLDEFLAVHAANLSAGGMFLATREPREVGSLLYVQFFLQDGQPIIEGMAKVIWVRPPSDDAAETAEAPAGMGVAFVSLDERSRELLRKVVAEHRDRVLGVTLLATREDVDRRVPELGPGVDDDMRLRYDRHAGHADRAERVDIQTQ